MNRARKTLQIKGVGCTGTLASFNIKIYLFFEDIAPVWLKADDIAQFSGPIIDNIFTALQEGRFSEVAHPMTQTYQPGPRYERHKFVVYHMRIITIMFTTLN
ncbi:hypothetical protein ACJX0J_011169 [Zea mays]